MTRCRLFVVVVGLSVFVGVAGAESLRLENARMSIAFDGATGDLVGMVDRARDHEHIAPGAGGLWHLDLDEDRAFVAADAAAFEGAVDGETATLTWHGFAAPGFETMRVTVTVTLPQDAPTATWRLAVEGLGDARLEEVRFPIVHRIAEQADEVLAVPVWMGEAVVDPRSTL